MIRKLRVKLVCILMALLTVMLGVTFGLVLHFTQQSLEAESLRTLEALANNWQTASSPGLDDGTRVPYFALEINARGDIITTRGGYFDLSDREKLQKLIDIAVNSEDDIGEVPDYGLRFYRVVTRTSWRVVFADTSAETTTLHSLIRTLAIASAAALAVFFVMSLLLARWLVRPVARAWDQQRQFVADASHELKTPVTILKGQLTGMLDEVGVYRDRDRYLARSLQVTSRMEALVGEILTISRMESGTGLRKEEVDLSRLVEEQLEQDRELLDQREMDLSLSLAPGLVLRGDPSLLGRAVDNLLSNAALYSPAGARIRVRTLRLDGRPTLVVENTGVQIGAEALPRLFEPFYREEQSRNRRTGGSGLGLYLVKMILDRHGARCEIENITDGVRARVIFPTEPAS